MLDRGAALPVARRDAGRPGHRRAAVDRRRRRGLRRSRPGRHGHVCGGKQHTVLVVESNPKWQDVFREGFKRVNYRVLVIADPGGPSPARGRTTRRRVYSFSAPGPGRAALSGFNLLAGDDRTSVPAALSAGRAAERMEGAGRGGRASHRDDDAHHDEGASQQAGRAASVARGKTGQPLRPRQSAVPPLYRNDAADAAATLFLTTEQCHETTGNNRSLSPRLRMHGEIALAEKLPLAQTKIAPPSAEYCAKVESAGPGQADGRRGEAEAAGFFALHGLSP